MRAEGLPGHGERRARAAPLAVRADAAAPARAVGALDAVGHRARGARAELLRPPADHPPLAVRVRYASKNKARHGRIPKIF